MKLTDPIPDLHPPRTVADYISYVEGIAIPDMQADREDVADLMRHGVRIIRAALEPCTPVPVRSRKSVTLRDQNFELSPVVHEYGCTHPFPTEADASAYVAQSEYDDARAGWGFYTSYGDSPVTPVANFETRELAIDSIREWFGDEVVVALDEDLQPAATEDRKSLRDTLPEALVDFLDNLSQSEVRGICRDHEVSSSDFRRMWAEIETIQNLEA